jgi:predicted DNA-binding protein with PD1-like motif
MTQARFIRQPGPALSPRIVAEPARGRALDLDLAAGLPLLEAVRRGFAASGFASGVVELGALALGPFAYVMPALSPDDRHAAFYSATFRPAGITWLEGGAMTFGRREGAPFFHCHALWREADGRRGGGHILPEETILAEPARVRAFGLDGAVFESRPDPETNFTIFGPVAADAGGAGDRAALAIRLRPNQDLHAALEAACAAAGIGAALIRGGVGSIIGARFEDGACFPEFATEVFIVAGTVARQPGGDHRAVIEAGFVNHLGALHRGRLARGENPVLMTFELVIEAVDGA